MKKRMLGWIVTVGILAVAAGLILWSYFGHRAEIAADAAGDAAIKNPAKVANIAGDPTVSLDDDVQERMGVKTETVQAMTRRQQVVAYGALTEDPAETFELRAPVSGTIQAAAWPSQGDRIADATRLGQLEPRIAPIDRVNLSDRLSAAQADVEASRASLAAAQTALTRTRTLNADNKNVSDRALQEAEARVATEQAKLNGAEQSVRHLSTQSPALPLEVTRGGIVAEVLAHPGESVESGQMLLRVTRYDKLLARVDVPAGQAIAPGLISATIVPLGNEAKPLVGQRVDFTGAIDPKTQGQPFLFRITDPTNTLRPGLSVTAYLETPGPARTGAVVPRNAVIWQSGKSWVYVQTDKEKFARREVVLEDPASAGWFTRSLKPGDKVVTTGAQMLLSEEFKSQIRVEDDDN